MPWEKGAGRVLAEIAPRLLLVEGDGRGKLLSDSSSVSMVKDNPLHRIFERLFPKNRELEITKQDAAMQGT